MKEDEEKLYEEEEMSSVATVIVKSREGERISY